MRVYRRKGSKSYQCEYYDAAGIRIQKSTRCRDYEAAQQRARQWEREAADPDGARLRSATLNEALELFVRSRAEMVGQGKRSADTLSFYTRKCGVLASVLGRDTRLATITAGTIADYVTARRGHLAVRPRKPKPPRVATTTAPGPKPRPAPAPRFITDHTIYKEVAILRAVLMLAKKRGLWRGDLDVVMPAQGELSAEYAPRKRWLPWNEVQLLLGELTKDKGARVGYTVALGAERGATDRALRADIMHKPADVLVRGTKRPSRWRLVPVVTAAQRELLDRVVADAEGEDGMLFKPWPNLDRDLKAACRRAGIAPCSMNDLRRSYGHWLRAGGVTTDLIGTAMGHVDSTMAERVYARLEPHELAARLSASLGVTPVSQPVPHSADSVDSVDGGSMQKPAEKGSEWCRRVELNYGPWDYDSSRLALPAARKPRKSHGAGGTVTVLSRPVRRNGGAA